MYVDAKEEETSANLFHIRILWALSLVDYVDNTVYVDCVFQRKKEMNSVFMLLEFVLILPYQY